MDPKEPENGHSPRSTDLLSQAQSLKHESTTVRNEANSAVSQLGRLLIRLAHIEIDLAQMLQSDRNKDQSRRTNK